MSHITNEFESDVLTKDHVEVKQPRPYHVVLYTMITPPWNLCVVLVLEKIFHHARPAAERLCLTYISGARAWPEPILVTLPRPKRCKPETQNHAVDAVASAIKLSRAGLNLPDKPIGELSTFL